MAEWLAAAYNVSGDGTVVWEQRRFSNLLRATPRPVRSALDMLRMLAPHCCACHAASSTLTLLQRHRETIPFHLYGLQQDTFLAAGAGNWCRLGSAAAWSRLKT